MSDSLRLSVQPYMASAIMSRSLSPCPPSFRVRFNCKVSIESNMAQPGSEYTVTSTPYPATTKTASTVINGTETTATTVYFADKILITVSQHGRLAHWVHVPLDVAATDNSLTSNPYLERDDDAPSSDLLPIHHLTATTILGGTIPELDVLGQTLATQIASALMTRDSGEKRMVVVGMGLDKATSGREEFSELVGLVLNVL